MKIENFKNIGFIEHTFDEAELIPLKNEIEEFKDKRYVWGTIGKEFNLPKSLRYTNDLLAPICEKFEENFNYLEQVNVLTRGLPLTLNNMWVNFQRKGEFFPIHNHAGIYSFVIWIKIPYNLSDERTHEKSRYPATAGPSHNLAGNFQFVYINSTGRIQCKEIPLDKTWENKMVLFPSSMHHVVYPFYTSDEDRISVSGNFKLLV
jgi:hypothetical protein